MTTCTERLRKLLDERGVEYDTDDLWNHAQKHDSTSWKCDNGKLANFSEIGYPHMTKLRIYDCTPEQAIAATLGNGTLTAEQVRELIAPHLHARPTFDFGHHGAVWRADFQAIADELNAALYYGECVPHGEWESISQSQEVRHVFCDCGYELGVDEHNLWPFQDTRLFARPNFCPECGRKIREAVKR